MSKNLGKILLAVGLLAAIFIIGKSVLYSPNGDTGLVLDSTNEINTPGTRGDAGYPARVQIPKLGIDAEVQHVGVTDKGLMAAPNNFTDVSWYKFGPNPGNTGSAVVAGHEDNAISLDGVFKHLEDLEEGDDIYVIDHLHKKHHFKVSEKKIHPYNLTGPELENIFNSQDGKARLNLITCTGDWLPSAKTNDRRLVVYTELVK